MFMFISISTAQKGLVGQHGLFGMQYIGFQGYVDISSFSTSFQMTLSPSLLSPFVIFLSDHWLIIADNVIYEEPLFKWHQMSTELCL